MKGRSIGKNSQAMGMRERRAVLRLSGDDVRQRKMIWEIANYTETI